MCLMYLQNPVWHSTTISMLQTTIHSFTIKLKLWDPSLTWNTSKFLRLFQGRMHSPYHIRLGNLQIICVFTWSSFLCSHTFWVGSRWNGYGHFWDLAQEKLVWKISLTWVYWDIFVWLPSLPGIIKLFLGIPGKEYFPERLSPSPCFNSYGGFLEIKMCLKPHGPRHMRVAEEKQGLKWTKPETCLWKQCLSISYGNCKRVCC